MKNTLRNQVTVLILVFDIDLLKSANNTKRAIQNGKLTILILIGLKAKVIFGQKVRVTKMKHILGKQRAI